MSFNKVDIFLFEKFFSSKTDSKLFLKMIQMNFNEKIDKANENKIINRLYDLPHIILNYLYYQVEGKILLKEKFSISINDKLYSDILNSYTMLNNEINTKFNFNKIPYNFFLEKEEKNIPNNNIFIDKNKTEFFFNN